MQIKVKETIDTMAAATATGVKKVRRALFAGVLALLQGLVLVTVGDGDEGLSVITTNQWLVIAISVLVAGGAVYGLTSRD